MLEEQHARKEMLTRIQRAQTGVVEPMPTLPAVTTDTVKRSVKNVRRGTILSDHSSSTHGSSRASTAVSVPSTVYMNPPLHQYQRGVRAPQEANVVMSSSAPSMRTLDSGNSDRSSAASSLTAASYGSDVGRGGMLHGLASSHGARRTSPLTHAYEQEIRRGSLASSRDGSNNSGRQAVTRPAAALPAAPRPQYPPGYYRGYTQNDKFGPNSRR